MGAWEREVSLAATDLGQARRASQSHVWQVLDDSWLGIDTSSEIINYWQGQSTFVTGLAQETCRDFTHTGYGLDAIAHIAETSRIQGQDLYPEIKERLLREGLPLFPPSTARHRTVRDALKGLPKPRIGMADIENHVLIPGARSYPGHTGSELDQPAKTLKAGDHGVPGLVADRRQDADPAPPDQSQDERDPSEQDGGGGVQLRVDREDAPPPLSEEVHHGSMPGPAVRPRDHGRPGAAATSRARPGRRTRGRRAPARAGSAGPTRAWRWRRPPGRRSPATPDWN